MFALTPLDEHELLVFWTELLVLVAFARLFGELMRRVNLPSVIGQLGAAAHKVRAITESDLVICGHTHVEVNAPGYVNLGTAWVDP